MRKFYFLLLVTSFIFGCSTDSTDSSSSSVYNPPTWIHGTWGLKANGLTVLNDNPFYRFTSDNVCQIIVNANSSMCWKETIQQTPSIMSGNDNSTSTTYEASLISGNGAQTTTLSFQKISSTKILWMSTSVGDVELEKLD